MTLGKALRAVWIGAFVFELSACEQIVDKVNELLQASRGDLQQKRALSLSETALPALQRLDVAFAVHKETFEALETPLLKSLNDSKTAKDNAISFKDVAFSFGPQRVGLSVDIAKTFDRWNVEGRVQVSSFVGAVSNALVWNLYVDGLEVTDISPSEGVTESAAKSLVEALNGLLPILNAVFDEAVNDDPDKAVLLSFDQKYLIKKQLADQSTDEAEEFRFDEKELATGLSTTATAVLIDEEGVFVAAQVEFVRPDQISDALPGFPADRDLIRISASDAAKRVAAYQSAVRALAGKWPGDEISPLIKLQKSGMAVSKSALARMLNFTVQQGAISGTAFLKKPSQSSTDLTFEINQRDCKGYFDGCDFKHVCEGDHCEKEVKKTIKKTCRVGCCLSLGPVGCLVHGLCDKACDEVTKVKVPIENATCGAFRAADKLHGGALCSIASNVDKAVCQVDANARKALCDTQQEVRRFYEANPVATVTASVKPDATLRVVADDVAISEDLGVLDATIAATGGGRIKASVDYDRKNYTDAVLTGGASLGLTCVADWNADVDIAVTADPFRERAKFKGTWRTDPDKTLLLVFTQDGDKTLYVDFKPPPLLALFVKPEFTLKCPLAAGLGATLGFAEAVFTKEDARRVLPLLTGEDFPIELKDAHFALKLKPMKLCSDFKQKDCGDPLATLIGQQKTSTVMFVEP